MPTYVSLYKFTEQGMRNIEGGPERLAKLKERFKAMGAEIKEFYALMGEYDSMIVAEAPDDVTIAKLNVIINTHGNVKSSTMRAFNEAEFKQLVRDIEGELKKAA